MEVCQICNGRQDSKHYREYNICTECADIMEDLMSEYFLRTIKSKNKLHLKYFENGNQYMSDYHKIREHKKWHIKHIEYHINEEIRKGVDNGKKRYLERLIKTINWLKSSPEFYSYYFKDYYVCSKCGASIFDNYNKQNKGDWLMITCEKCNSIVKKYFSPKFIN